MAGARDSAVSLQRDYIGSEDILLALLRLPDSRAVKMVGGVQKAAVIEEAVLKATVKGHMQRLANLPFDPNAKKVLERALEEAMRQSSPHIGTEHLIVGVALVRCPGSEILASHFAGRQGSPGGDDGGRGVAPRAHPIEEGRC